MDYTGSDIISHEMFGVSLLGKTRCQRMQFFQKNGPKFAKALETSFCDSMDSIKSLEKDRLKLSIPNLKQVCSEIDVEKFLGIISSYHGAMILRAFAKKFQSEYKMISKKDFYIRSIGVIDETWTPVYCASSGLTSCKCTYHVNPPEGEFAYVKICNGRAAKTKLYFNSVLKAPLTLSHLKKKKLVNANKDSSGTTGVSSSTESSDEVKPAGESVSLASKSPSKLSSEASMNLDIKEEGAIGGEVGGNKSDDDDSNFEDYSETDEEGKTTIGKTPSLKPPVTKSSSSSELIPVPRPRSKSMPQPKPKVEDSEYTSKFAKKLSNSHGQYDTYPRSKRQQKQRKKKKKSSKDVFQENWARFATCSAEYSQYRGRYKEIVHNTLIELSLDHESLTYGVHPFVMLECIKLPQIAELATVENVQLLKTTIEHLVAERFLSKIISRDLYNKEKYSINQDLPTPIYDRLQKMINTQVMSPEAIAPSLIKLTKQMDEMQTLLTTRTLSSWTKTATKTASDFITQSPATSSQVDPSTSQNTCLTDKYPWLDAESIEFVRAKNYVPQAWKTEKTYQASKGL